MARAGAAEPRLRRLPAAARRRHRRLGRRLAGDRRPRQPRGALARDRAAARGDRVARAHARAAPAALPGARGRPRPVGRSGRRPGGAPSLRRDGPRPRGPLGAGRAGRRCPFIVRRDALPLELGGEELGEEEIVRLLSARGTERERVLAAADATATRGVRRRGHATSSPGTSSTRTSATSSAASARSPRASWPRTCAGRPSSCRWTRSCAAPWRRGTGARPRCACRAASTRRSRATTTPRSSRAIRAAVPGDPRPRVLRARGVAGRRDARRLARRVPRAPARPRPRLAAGHRGRDPRRRRAGDHLPRQGLDRAVARRARRRPPGRAPLERDDDVGARRAAGALGEPPAAGAGAAGPDGRLHGVRAAAVRAHGGADVPQGPRAPRADVRRGRCSCTPSRGSRSTR